MSAKVDSSSALRRTSRRMGRRMLLPTGIVVVALALLWMMQSMPSVCPAIYPAPPSCMANARLAPAVSGGAILVAVLAVTLILDASLARFTARAMTRGRRDNVRLIMVGLLAVTAVVALATTLFASGFALPFALPLPFG
jgi:hypothetical protein